MTTHVFTKDQIIDQLNSLIKDDDIIVFSTDRSGTMCGASKKKDFKQIGFGLAADAFKDEQTCIDLMNSFSACMVILDKKYVSDQIMSEVSEYRKSLNKGVE